jgi:hypothetical protein
MAAYIIPALLGLPGLIGGIMEAVHSGKKLTGGRLVMARKLLRHPVYANQLRQALRAYRMRGRGMMMIHRRRRGRGIASSIAGAIPLIGPLLGPLIGAMGGRVRRRNRRRTRGTGLVPMSIYQPIATGGRLVRRKRPMGRSINGRRGGLLSPTGMGVRRGHYRYVNGRRVYVRPTMVHGGRVRRRRRY